MQGLRAVSNLPRLRIRVCAGAQGGGWKLAIPLVCPELGESGGQLPHPLQALHQTREPC